MPSGGIPLPAQIVPPPSNAPGCAGLPEDPTLSQALAIVRASELARRGDTAPGAAAAPMTVASQAIQRSVRGRFAGYPTEAISQGRHCCICRIPSPLARLLRMRPQLLSPAVRCFYERGPEDLQAAAAMRYFGREQHAWVRVRVRFTKCLFAQMSKQQFFPPKGLQLPPREDPLFTASERGIKLAAAFEMLYHRSV
jgi:hypothetical protein